MSIEDDINKIGIDQSLKAIMQVANQVASYYLVLRQEGIPVAVAQALTVGFQVELFAMQSRQPPAAPPNEEQP